MTQRLAATLLVDRLCRRQIAPQRTHSYDDGSAHASKIMKCVRRRWWEVSSKTSAPILPTRIIDVGPLDGSIDPRLVEARNNSSGFYASLSYCWGPTHKASTYDY